jgi:hypothetical protein
MQMVVETRLTGRHGSGERLMHVPSLLCGARVRRHTQVGEAPPTLISFGIVFAALQVLHVWAPSAGQAKRNMEVVQIGMGLTDLTASSSLASGASKLYQHHRKELSSLR